MFRVYKNMFRLINRQTIRKELNVFNKARVGSAFPIKITTTLCSYTFNNRYSTFDDGSFNKYLALTILGWLGFADEDEEKESELIMTLKRSVLATQREQYDKAEQLLHIALRLAQQQQNEQGVVYCYDLMANLAMNRLELDKAEKLFVTVLQMLLSKGIEQNDLKVCRTQLHITKVTLITSGDPHKLKTSQNISFKGRRRKSRNGV